MDFSTKKRENCERDDSVFSNWIFRKVTFRLVCVFENIFLFNRNWKEALISRPVRFYKATVQRKKNKTQSSICEMISSRGRMLKNSNQNKINIQMFLFMQIWKYSWYTLKRPRSGNTQGTIWRQDFSCVNKWVSKNRNSIWKIWVHQITGVAWPAISSSATMREFIKFGRRDRIIDSLKVNEQFSQRSKWKRAKVFRFKEENLEVSLSLKRLSGYSMLNTARRGAKSQTRDDCRISRTWREFWGLCSTSGVARAKGSKMYETAWSAGRTVMFIDESGNDLWKLAKAQEWEFCVLTFEVKPASFLFCVTTMKELDLKQSGIVLKYRQVHILQHLHGILRISSQYETFEVQKLSSFERSVL